MISYCTLYVKFLVDDFFFPLHMVLVCLFAFIPFYYLMLLKEIAVLHSSCQGCGYHAEVTFLACTSSNLSPDGVVGGMVLRVNTAALPKPKQKTHRAAEALDAHNRGNMMKRIQARKHHYPLFLPSRPFFPDCLPIHIILLPCSEYRV
jgi:hypothetical protein